eukprot:4401420-Pyramimonas_sp.AAC.1
MEALLGDHSFAARDDNAWVDVPIECHVHQRGGGLLLLDAVKKFGQSSDLSFQCVDPRVGGVDPLRESAVPQLHVVGQGVA